MKKLVTITLVFLLAAGVLLTDSRKAEAMNNESAAVLAGAIAIFGLPVMNAIAREIAYPGQTYATYPARVRAAYPETRYVERTKIIYAEPRHRRLHEHRDWRHDGWHHDDRCVHDHRRDCGGHGREHRCYYDD